MSDGQYPTIQFRVDARTKEKFMLVCQAQSLTPSEILRKHISLLLAQYDFTDDESVPAEPPDNFLD